MKCICGIHSMRYTPNTFAIQVYPSVLSRIHWIRMGYTYGYCICPLAPGYAQDTPRMRVSAPWLPMSAKILPKYAADTRICTPFLPSSTFLTHPEPPEQGAAPPPRRSSPARAEGFASAPECSSSVRLSSSCPSAGLWAPLGSAG